MNEQQPEYVTIAEAGKAVGRSVPTIWVIIRKHELPTFQKGTSPRTYVRLADVQRVMTEFHPKEKRQTT